MPAAGPFGGRQWRVLGHWSRVPRILVVHHTVSPPLDTLLRAVVDGATRPELPDVEVVTRPALTASAVDVLEADGYVLGTPANLGSMSGALKHFFDSIYYPCLDATQRRPWGLYVHGNNDVDGARARRSSGSSPASAGGRSPRRCGWSARRPPPTPTPAGSWAPPWRRTLARSAGVAGRSLVIGLAAVRVRPGSPIGDLGVPTRAATTVDLDRDLQRARVGADAVAWR